MSTTNLGIIKSEANPLTGTRVQLNTGGWFIAESSAVQKSKIESNKTQTITENGTGIEITPSSGKEAMSKVTLTVNVEGTGDIQENKAVTITTNTVTEITPDDGKDGMAKVTVTTNVPTTSVTPPEWYDNGKDTVLWTRSGGVVGGISFVFFLTDAVLDNSVFPYQMDGTYYSDSDFEYWADNYFDSPQDSITMAQWLKCVNYDRTAQEMETCNLIGSFNSAFDYLCAIFVGTH